MFETFQTNDDCPDQAAGAIVVDLRRRRIEKPIAPKPNSIVAHVAGSGTDVAKKLPALGAKSAISTVVAPLALVLLIYLPSFSI